MGLKIKTVYIHHCIALIFCAVFCKRNCHTQNLWRFNLETYISNPPTISHIRNKQRELYAHSFIDHILRAPKAGEPPARSYQTPLARLEHI
jgi:hypothetical protein